MIQLPDEQPAALVLYESAVTPLNRRPWEAVVNWYLKSAISNEGTRRAYRRHLKNAGLLFGLASVDELTGEDLTDFKATVVASGLAPASQAQAISALRSFLAWTGGLGAHRLPPQMIATALKTPKATVQVRCTVLNEKEVGSLLSHAPSPRERAILAVLLGAGLRCAEAANLAVTDIFEDADGGVALFIRLGKGGRDRVVPIGAEVDVLLRHYLVASGRLLGSEGPLFLANDRGAGGRSKRGLSTRAISRLIGDLAKLAGISAKRVTPHALRHTFAIRCLRSGGNVVAVSKLLGHATWTTTNRYVDHLAISELRSAVPALPLGGVDESDAA